MRADQCDECGLLFNRHRLRCSRYTIGSRKNMAEERVRTDPRVAEVSDERDQGDGIWAYTARGYCNHADGTGGAHHAAADCRHNVHEDTWTAVLRRLPAVKPCTCERCTGGDDGQA